MFPPTTFVNKLFVGLAGALLWLRKALQSGKTCVKAWYDIVLHRSMLILSLLQLEHLLISYKMPLLQVVGFHRSGRILYSAPETR